ncbi:ribulose-phosphate 3-epimerase [Balneolaceae bacterium ANBcel3]|nr:ribulose-phosphate 3-epimerase [Balneolaceae bacterium ANBcel3]
MLSCTPPVIAPSLLASNLKHLEQDIKNAEKGGAEWFHCDIMDGHFVPNISFGPMLVEAANSCTNAFIDVHLMIEEPHRFIPMFADAGAQLITVHLETCTHLHQTLQMIRDHGCHTGVAINPGTSLCNLQAIAESTDLILLMTVNPGFGGQKIIDSSFDRIRSLKVLRDELKSSFQIQVDGGIHAGNVREIAAAGADIIVAGSKVFQNGNIAANVTELIDQARAGYTSTSTS